MAFKRILSELLERLPDGLGAIIVDWEGEAVDQVGVIDDFELKLIGAHKGLILTNLRQAVARVEGNDLLEIAITTDRVQTLILPVDEEYFLVLALKKGEAYGRALFEARRCLDQLRKEIC